ncbi:hypothetical protein ACPPVT_01095 [Angustibacter sp. McL0619]|uniref:hypothetical protein n=1 Tax=Angustibacter sp. McL0619 TaxID=3415676 RepID=UPI003CED829B
MDASERHELIDAVVLPEASMLRGSWVPASDEATAGASGDKAQICAGALLAYDRSLSREDGADISNSTLFAQLAADAQADRFAQAAQWSTSYTNVLGVIGWVIGQAQHGSPGRLDAPVDWPEVVAKAFAGHAGAALAAKTMKAATRLPLGGAALEIWEANAAQVGQGNFIVQACQSSNGDVLGDAVQVTYTLIREPDGFLSWVTYYEVATTTTQSVLNEDVYKVVRQQIIDKLGDLPDYYNAPVPL